MFESKSGPPGLAAGRNQTRRRSWLVLFLSVAALSFSALPAAEAASANVTSHGGPVQTEPHVYPIFWGSAWNSSLSAERTKVMTMYNDLNTSIGSGWQGILTQYWAPKAPPKNKEASEYAFVSHTVLIGGSYTDSEAPPAGVTTTNLEAEIKKAIEAQAGAGSWPKSVAETTVNDQFTVFVPPGTTWGSGLNPGGCGSHHNSLGKYAFSRVAREYEKRPGELLPCSATVTAAHEYAEAVTNPYGAEQWKNAWRDWVLTGNDELVDICDTYGREIWSGEIEVPEIWDRENNTCVGSHANPAQKAPVITALEPVGISGTKATLLGSAELNGLEVDEYWFEWGEGTGAYEHKGHVEYSPNLIFGAHQEISGLKPNRSYHFRIVLRDKGGEGAPTQMSADRAFTTVPIPPVVTIEPPTGVEAGHATLHGTVNPRGFATKYWFEWGPTESYGGKSSGEAGSGSTAKPVEATIGGLNGSAAYFYRLVAESSEGRTEVKGSFGTPDWSPGVATGGAVEVTGRTFELQGTVDPKGFATSYKFEYGKTGYEHVAEGEGSVSGSGEQAVAADIGGLEGGVTYTYRLVATNNGNGNAVSNGGAQKGFTTPKWRPGISAAATSGLTATAATLRAAINPNGFATSYHFEWATQKEFEEGKYGHRLPIAEEIGIGSGDEAVEVSQAIEGLAANSTYHFRAVASNSEGSQDGDDQPFRTAPLFVRKFGGEGSGAGHLAAPQGIVTDAAGNTWVADTGHNRIQKFNSKGEFVLQFGAQGTGNGQFGSPRGLAVDSSGNLWVADTNNHRLQKFSSSGEFLAKIEIGSGTGALAPQDVALDSAGRLWVVGAMTWPTTPQVRQLTTSGETLREFGVEGTGNGQFSSEPKGIAIDAAGNLWVADTYNNRLEEFSSTGSFIRTAGTKGTGNGQLGTPKDVVIDSSGNLWVADTGNSRVQEFTSTGTYLSQFGAAGNNDGQFAAPQALTLDAAGNAWVADTGNDRVQEWGP
jgi:sugar lactone lactonase YvrE